MAKKSLLDLEEEGAAAEQQEAPTLPSSPGCSLLPLVDPLTAAMEGAGQDDDSDDDDTVSLVPPEAARSKHTLALCFVALVLVGFLNNVFAKLQSLPMAPYVNTSNLLVTFAYIPLSLLWVVPMARTGRIPAEDLRMSKRPFVVMGLLDAMSGLMLFFALVQLSVDLANLLQQSAIPISMLLSRVILKVRYSRYQFLGALIVVLGITVVLLPHMRSGDDHANVLSSSAILVLSCVPMTLSSIYKEVALAGRDLDPTYLNLWVATFQLLFSVPLAVPTALAEGMALSDLPTNLWNGLLCYFGVDAVPVSHAGRCAVQGPFFVNAYIAVNFVYNILVIAMLKFGGANLLWLALTVRVPVINIATSVLTFIPGSKPMGPADAWGLLIILMGLVTYRFGKQLWARVKACRTTTVITTTTTTTTSSMAAVEEEGGGRSLSIASDLTAPLLSDDDAYDEQGDDELARKVEVLNLNIAKLHSTSQKQKKKEKVPPPLAEGPSPIVQTTVVG